MIRINKIFIVLALCSALHAAEIGHIFPKKVLNSSEKFNGTKAEICGTASNSIHYFPVESNSPNGIINLLYAQYSAGRGLPISTTTYHDSMNHQQLVSRVDNFRKYPCPELSSNEVQADCSKTYKMTPAQSAKSGYTSFDRGHMAPVNPYRFHADAVSNTFFCVNIAPQEPFTNQGPWNTIEDRVYRRTSAGYVMTGLCQANSADGPSLDGVQVPDCFWKLLCYKEGTQTIVVGFIGENALFDKNDESAKDRRRIATLTARSQQDIINRNGDAAEISKAWTSAAASLLTRREGNLAPTASACNNAKTLPSDVADEWSRIIDDEFHPSLIPLN